MRERIIPDHLLSRVNSAYRTIGWGILPIGTALGGLVVSLAEPLFGRDAALRAPYVVAAVITAGLVIFAGRTLTTRIIRAAEAEAEANADRAGVPD